MSFENLYSPSMYFRNYMVDRFRSCNAMHADASVRSCICPRRIQRRRRGGCRHRYTGLVGIACPSSSTGHPTPSPPAHIVVKRLGNSVWGFSDGSSRGGRRQLSSPLFLFIIVLIVVYDIEQPQGEGEEGTTGDTESSHGGEEAI